MSRLMDELRKDPNAVFEVNADLPSGNRMLGTVGPLLNGRLCASVHFSQIPPSTEDVSLAKAIMVQQIGSEPEQIASVNDSADASAIVRNFVGGGKG